MSGIFTFHPNKEILQPFQKRFSKRETTVRKWTFGNIPDSAVNQNKTTVKTLLDKSTLNSLSSESQIPAILKGLSLPSSTPDGSDSGSEFNYEADKQSSSQFTDSNINVAKHQFRTKQTIQKKTTDCTSSSSDVNVSSSSSENPVQMTSNGDISSGYEIRTNNSELETHSSTSSTETSNVKHIEKLRRSPRKRPNLSTNNEHETLSSISNLSGKETTIPSEIHGSLRKYHEQKNSHSGLNINKTKQVTETNNYVRKSPRKRLETAPVADSEIKNSIRTPTSSSFESPRIRSRLESVITEKRPKISSDLESESSKDSKLVDNVLTEGSGKESDNQSLFMGLVNHTETPKRGSRSQKSISSLRKSCLKEYAKIDKNGEDLLDKTRKSLQYGKTDVDMDVENLRIESSIKKTVVVSEKQVKRKKSEVSENQQGQVFESYNQQGQVSESIVTDTYTRRRSSRLTKHSSERSININESRNTDTSYENREAKQSLQKKPFNIEKPMNSYKVKNQTVNNDTKKIQISDNATDENPVVENLITQSEKLPKGKNKKQSTAMVPVDVNHDKLWDTDPKSNNVSTSSMKDLSLNPEKFSTTKVKESNEEEDLVEEYIFSDSTQHENGESPEDIFDVSDDQLRRNKSKGLQNLTAENEQKQRGEGQTLSPPKKLKLSGNKCNNNILGQEIGQSSKEQGDILGQEIGQSSKEQVPTDRKEDNDISMNDVDKEERQPIDTNIKGQDSEHNKSETSQDGVEEMQTEEALPLYNGKVNEANHSTVEYDVIERPIRLESKKDEIVKANQDCQIDRPFRTESDTSTKVVGDKDHETDRPVRPESILMSSETPKKISSKKVVRKKVRIVSDETESDRRDEQSLQDHTINMWRGHDRNRTSRDVVDLDVVLNSVTNIIEQQRALCDNNVGKKALNSLLVYTRKEITDLINKIEELRGDKKDLSGSKKDVKMLRGKLLELQSEKTSLLKKIKAKKDEGKCRLRGVNQWFIGMTQLMKTKQTTKSPQKLEYVTYGNFPANIGL